MIEALAQPMGVGKCIPDVLGLTGVHHQASSLNGSNGFIVYGVHAGDQAGISVSTGDVNGDGEQLLVVGQ